MATLVLVVTVTANKPYCCCNNNYHCHGGSEPTDATPISHSARGW